MIKIDKKITVAYSYAGTIQYADFLFKDGKVISNTFNPNWCKGDDRPDINNIQDFDKIMEILTVFSFSEPKIFSIDDLFPKFYENVELRKVVDNKGSKLNEIISTECFNFFKEVILPILNKNNWKLSYSWCGYPIVIFFDNEINDWNNVDKYNDDYILINVISTQFLNDSLDLNLKDDTEYKSKMTSDNLIELTKRINDTDLKTLNIIKENL